MCHAVSIIEFYEKVGGFRVLPVLNVHWYHEMAKKEGMRDPAVEDMFRLITRYMGT